VAALTPAGHGLQLDAITQLREPLPALASAVPSPLQQLQVPAASLALISDPAQLLSAEPNSWSALVGPLLQRALASLNGPLPPLVAAADQGPLLWAQQREGWLLGTPLQQPPLEAIQDSLAGEGYSGSPLQSRGLNLQAWTRLESKPVKGNPDQLQAQLAGARAVLNGWAWWGQGLAVLNQQSEAHHPPQQRLEQLDALATPKAPFQWSMDGATAQDLLAGWRPWRLVTSLSSTSLTPLVEGAALSLDADASNNRALRLRAQLQLQG
jgi:hypothetical protein